MTYCLGILLSDGLVLASDSRTNAGVDQIAKVCKLSILENPGRSLTRSLKSLHAMATMLFINPSAVFQ